MVKPGSVTQRLPDPAICCFGFLKPTSSFTSLKRPLFRGGKKNQEDLQTFYLCVLWNTGALRKEQVFTSLDQKHSKVCEQLFQKDKVSFIKSSFLNLQSVTQIPEPSGLQIMFHTGFGYCWFIPFLVGNSW